MYVYILKEPIVLLQHSHKFVAELLYLLLGEVKQYHIADNV